jgi:hypothetical protein
MLGDTVGVELSAASNRTFDKSGGIILHDLWLGLPIHLFDRAVFVLIWHWVVGGLLVQLLFPKGRACLLSWLDILVVFIS